MITIHERFQEVKLTGHKTIACPKCGKKLRRQQTFSQTLNPWNRLPNGRLKTPEDIYPQLQAKIEHWKTEPELCGKCKEEECRSLEPH